MLTNSTAIPTLVAQLQARYPTASLVAEFVTIHQDSFVVRALVQVGSITLATGMATATDIEQAEDRAKVRAMNALGIGSFTAPLPSQPSSYTLPLSPGFNPLVEPATVESATETPGNTPSAEDSLRSSVASSVANLTPAPLIESLQSLPKPDSTVLVPDLPAPVPPFSFAQSAEVTSSPQPESDRTEYELSYEPASYEFNSSTPENYSSENYQLEDASITNSPSTVEALSESIPSELTQPQTSPDPIDVPKSQKSVPVAGTGKGKSTKRKSESTEGASPPAEDNDRSEEIAKIGLEMKRLGWTTEQGRNYLKRTYGKRSRQELDDSELVDFLRYLEAQVSPSESPF